MLIETGVLKICSKFTGEHPCPSVISIKFQSNFIEITFRHGCISSDKCPRCLLNFEALRSAACTNIDTFLMYFFNIVFATNHWQLTSLSPLIVFITNICFLDQILAGLFELSFCNIFPFYFFIGKIKLTYLFNIFVKSPLYCKLTKVYFGGTSFVKELHHLFFTGF